MHWQYTNYFPPLLVLALASASMGVLFWRRKLATPRVGTIMMFAGAEWLLTVSLEVHAVPISWKIFFNELQYVGVTTLLTALTVMTLLVLGDYRWVGPGKWKYWIIPIALGSLLVLTNRWHGLVWPHHQLEVVDGIILLEHPHGPGYYFYYVYGFFVITVAIVRLLRLLGSRMHLYQRQAVLLLTALCIPLVVALLELLLGRTLLPHISSMPIAFVVGATFYVVAVLYLRAGDLVPVARDHVVDTIDEALVVLDLQHRVVDCNLAAQTLMGRSVQECLGHDLHILWPEGAQVLLPLIAQGGLDTKADDVIIRSRGRAQHFNVRALPVQAWRGVPGIQVIVLQDITERKEAELALVQSEARFRRLAETLPDLLLLVDPICYNIVYANRPTFLGNTVKPGRYIQADGFEAIHPEDRARVQAIYKRFATGELGQNLNQEYRTVPQLDAPEITWLQSRATTLSYNHDGTPHEIMLVLSDITTRKQAEAQRLELALNQEKIRLLADFVQNITHEVRTPLTVINTQLYLLEKRYLAAQPVSEMQVVKSQLHYIHSLIDDMLTMLRLDNEVAPPLVTFDLNCLIRGFYDQALARCTEKDLAIQLCLAPDLPLCSLPGEFPRAIENLLDNAIIYSPPGGALTLSTALEGQNMVIGVADTGMGIQPEHLPHVFERFYRVDQARTARQVGLGLPIAQRIVELAHGRIEVHSSAGEGAAFRVVLPCPPAED